MLRPRSGVARTSGLLVAVVPTLSLIDWPVAPLFHCEVLGAAEAVRLGGCTGVLILPRQNPEAIDVDTYDCPILPPEQYLDSPLARAYPQVYWGEHLSWPRLLTEVRTLLVQMDFECETDDDLPHRINSVQDAFEEWFGLLRDWLGVLTKQDLCESEPRHPSPAPGQRFTVWYRLRDGKWKHAQGRQTIKASPPQFDKAISAADWTRAVEAANRGRAAPAEHLLIRDAREALERDNPRRCILSAGLAAELALGAAVREELGRLGAPPGRVDRSLDRLTLGRLVSSVRTFMPSLWLPSGISTKLVKKRNEAAHTSRELTVADARASLEIAESLVSRYVPLT